MSERTASEAGDEPHPSASGSMRASASGSRRIVHLVDVRPPGESQSRGRIPASESQSRGQIPATEAATGEAASPPTVTGHAGEATMQRAVSAALRGASIDASPRDAEADPATSSSSSLSRIRRDESTIQAITGEDDTLATSGLHSRPSRGVITWVAAAVAAMVVGTAGYAFYTSEVERDMEADAVVASVATPVTPSIGPMIVPEAVVAPTAPIDEPAEPEAAEAVAEAAVVAAVAEPPASGRRSKKGGKTKPTKARVRKRTREAEPEEDDVLEQVRKYMRQKQEAEAARKAAAANPPQGALAGP